MGLDPNGRPGIDARHRAAPPFPAGPAIPTVPPPRSAVMRADPPPGLPDLSAILPPEGATPLEGATPGHPDHSTDTEPPTTDPPTTDTDSGALLLARTMAQLADSLVEGFDVANRLSLLAEACTSLLSVSHVAFLLVRPQGEELELIAASRGVLPLVERYQLHAPAGPWQACQRTASPVSQDDVPVTVQRPASTSGLVDFLIPSVHALPLRRGDEVIGVLLLCTEEGGALRPEERRAAQMLADVVALATLRHRALARSEELAEQLTRAIQSRAIIELAKGLLAETRGHTMDEAFGLLRKAARDSQRRVAAVAWEIVDTGPPWDALDTFIKNI
jgi:ANTAR domain/GAF domain